MPSIKVNNEILEYNNIIYVDSVNGDDTVGDGSEGNPYKSLQVSINNVSVNNAIYLKEGNYNINIITDLMRNLSYVDFIGEGLNSVIEIESDTNTPLTIIDHIQFINIRFTLSENYTASDYMRIWSNRGSGNFYFRFKNCVFEDLNNKISTVFISLGWSNSESPKYHKGWSNFENCSANMTCELASVIVGSEQPNVLVQNCSTSGSKLRRDVEPTTSLENVTYDSSYNITSLGWENTGTGLNPDETQANIGVYGGLYAWGDWPTIRNFLIKSNNLIYSLDTSNNLVDVTSQIIDINNITQLEYETLGFDDMSLVNMIQLENLQSPKSVIYYTDYTPSTNPKLKHEYSFNIGTRLLKRG